MKIETTNDNPQQFRPFCMRCNWRKGGPDSWDRFSCKCGHSEPPIRMIEKLTAPTGVESEHTWESTTDGW
jgi:hypothetical protein